MFVVTSYIAFPLQIPTRYSVDSCPSDLTVSSILASPSYSCPSQYYTWAIVANCASGFDRIHTYYFGISTCLKFGESKGKKPDYPINSGISENTFFFSAFHSFLPSDLNPSEPRRWEGGIYLIIYFQLSGFPCIFYFGLFLSMQRCLWTPTAYSFWPCTLITPKLPGYRARLSFSITTSLSLIPKMLQLPLKYPSR